MYMKSNDSGIVDSDATHSIMPQAVINDVLKSAMLGIWNFTEGGEYGFRAMVSDECRQLFGLGKDVRMSPDELYRYWRDRIFPDDRRLVELTMERLKTVRQAEVNYRWIHPTLGLRFVRCGGLGRKNAEGKWVFEGYHYDITDLLENYKQNTLVAGTLARTYAFLCYMDLEKDWYTAYWTEASNERSILPRSGKLSGTNVIVASKLCSEKEYDKVKRFSNTKTMMERLRDTPAISMICEGSVAKWIKITYVVIDRDTEGNARHLIGAIKDVSDQHEHELRLIHSLNESIEADRSRTMMFQNMIHEIRTPLNAMFGFSQLLCVPGVEVTDEQKQEYFNIINNSYSMLTKLIDDVLDIVNAKHGNFRIRKKDFLVNNMCRQTVQLAKIRVQAGVRLYFTSEVPDDYCINSDELRIEQVIINFLTNACKHTYEGEIHLHVSEKENPGHLTFSVTDTGTGVAPEMADDIFKRYKKANYNVNGTGMGLHICSIIAERLNGKVMLDKSYTGGARFLFII